MSGLTAVKQRPGGGFRELRQRFADLRGRHQSLTSIVGLAIVAAVLPLVVLLPPLNGFGIQKDWVGSFANAGVFVLLAIGLNVVVGLAGLLDLGYAAFFAIGAYTFAYGASGFTGVHIPFWLMLPVGAVVAALFGLALGAPTLRLRGDYLAIVTLGFGEIVPVVFLNADTYTKGTNGITGLDQPNLYGAFGIHGFGFTNPWPYYFTVIIIIAIAFVLLHRLQDSRLGRAWVAIREDELAAASMGINTVTTKLLAFAIGASTSGLAGVFSASKLAIVSPDQFGFTVSFTALAMVVLGGMGSTWSVAAGAFIVYELQSQGLKQLDTFVRGLHIAPFALGPLSINLNTFEFLNFQYLLYGLALVLMMLFRPEGLFPSRTRKRELHAADELDPDEDPEETGLGEAPGAGQILNEDGTAARGMGEGR
ncbi:MAG TPA: branched-chain amino acid ABC transporter permease [Candidatus Limnocylindrales bacterium]